MRRGLLILGTLAVLAVTNVAASPDSEEAAVLKVATAARTAVLDDQPRSVCRLLTRRARRNSLIAGNYADLPRRRRLNTCVDAVGFLIDEERDGNRLFVAARRQPSRVRFQVIRVRGKRAHLRMRIDDPRDRYTDVTDIYFLKSAAGWRADFAGFSPFDGSSGR